MPIPEDRPRRTRRRAVDEFDQDVPHDEKITVAPSKSKVKPAGKATVRETRQIVYDADVETIGDSGAGETKEKIKNEDSQRDFDRDRPRDLGYSSAWNSRTPFVPFEPKSEPKNTVSHFFQILGEEEEEAFLLFITRQPDMPSERYAQPQVLHPASFPIMQITKYDAPNFVQMLQQLNGNSGGRFTIRATYLSGEPIDDASLHNFCIPNPAKPDKEDSGVNGGGDMQQTLVDIFDRLQTQQSQQLQAIAELISKKKEEDEFSKIAKQLLMKKLLEDPAPKEQGFNPERLAETLFTSQQMIEIMSRRFAKSFDVEERSDRPAWLEFLESDTGKIVAEKAGNVVSALAMLGAQKMAQAPAPPPGAAPAPEATEPVPQQIPSAQNGNQPQPPTTEEERQLIVDTTKLTQFIIEELESDNPINAENVALQELEADYPGAFGQVKMICKISGPEQLIALLEAFVPEAFVDLKNDDGSFNEKGLKIVERLNEFHAFYKES